MFEWLFPGWSDPLWVTAFVAARLLCNAALTALAARSVGRDDAHTRAAAALTLASAAATVSLLRPGGLGYPASVVELAAEGVLIAAAVHAVRSNPSRRRVVAGAACAVAAFALLALSVPLYGEAFVAP